MRWQKKFSGLIQENLTNWNDLSKSAKLTWFLAGISLFVELLDMEIFMTEKK